MAKEMLLTSKYDNQDNHHYQNDSIMFLFSFYYFYFYHFFQFWQKTVHNNDQHEINIFTIPLYTFIFLGIP